MILTGMTYSLDPCGGSLARWGNPFVLGMIFGGLAVNVIFAVTETQLESPTFRLSQFRRCAFWAGNLAQFLGAVGRGGFQSMLMIWFKGIWLPQNGDNFTVTPL